MPRKEILYENTIIYKLVCNDITIKELYVGHTTHFVKRKACHKSDCNNENSKSYNYNVYKFIRSNGGFNNWSMIQIEAFDCKNQNEACARERHHIEQLNAKLNSCIPGKTEIENKENIKEYKKAYYEKNIEKSKEVHKLWRDANKEKTKTYQILNKDHINQQRRENYLKKKNKDI